MIHKLYLGIMSGTSLDGIDVAVCDFEQGKVDVIATHSESWPENLREELLAVARSEVVSLDIVAGLHFTLAKIYAGVVERALAAFSLEAIDVEAIGLHGQTVRHLPVARHYATDAPSTGATLQLGSPPALAALTGINVVGDFRSGDVALGGQGAPLMPMFDYAFLRSANSARLVTNIGGITNITWIPTSGEREEVVAFDTGPGNMILDSLAREFLGSAYDANGAGARTGRIDVELLDTLLSHSYFVSAPPKSTGRELFGDIFYNKFETLIKHGDLKIEDALATATELTARSITMVPTVIGHTPTRRSIATPLEIIVSGGGARNGYLMERIAINAPNATVITSEAIGIDAQYKESIAFAYFAKAFCDRIIIHLPKTTGASRNILLGSFSPGSAA